MSSPTRAASSSAACRAGRRIPASSRSSRAGPAALFDRIQLQPVETAVAGWAQQFGCSSTAKDEAIGNDVRLRSYRGCTNGVKVELYTVDGGGHTWPGAMPVDRLGATTDTIDATKVVVDSLPDFVRS